MPAASVIVGKSATDLKVQTEVAIYPVILIAVRNYQTAVESKVWLMVMAAVDARIAMGEGDQVEKQVRDLFHKAFAEEHKALKPGKLTEDPQYVSCMHLCSKVCKVAFYYAKEALKKHHKNGTGFYTLYNKIPKAASQKKKSKTSFVEDLKEKADDGPVSAGDVKGRFKDVPLDSGNRPLGVKKSAAEPPTTSSWTRPDMAGEANDEIWEKESLAIISDQFPRFLAMIKQALEDDELTRSKRDQLLVLIK